MVPQHRRRRHAALPAVLTALASLSLVSACDKVPLLAPSGAVITLFPASLSVPINGEIDIVAVVIENGVTAPPPTTGTGGGTTTTNQPGAGTPVQNGTLVSFTTTLGRIEPAEARTNNGQVRVKFIASGQSGLATITAFSGGASGKIENLAVGAAAAERITVSASPQNLPAAGGQTVVSARVEDAAGTGLSGIPVTFRTTAGTLNPTSSITNASGVATTTLTTSTAAEVTATAGSETGDIDISLSPRLISSFTASPQATSAGVPVTFTVTAGTTGNIANATIDFGDGSSQPLGSFTGPKSISHPYSSPDIYTARVTASDSLGATETQTTSVSIGRLPVTLIANPSRTGPNNPITFTVGGTSQAQVRGYRWNFGDGTPVRETGGPQTSHAYSQRATYLVRVQVIGLDGNVIGDAETSVVIEGL